MPDMLLQSSLSNRSSQQLCTALQGSTTNSWLESATCSLLLPTAALQNKSTVKQQHGFQVYYPEVFLTAHISCKAFTPPQTSSCTDCQAEFSLLMPHFTTCMQVVWTKLSQLHLHPQNLMVFSKIHIIVQMMVA